MENGNGKKWSWLVPTLLGVITAISVDTNQKLFHHLTNDEIHCPRTMMVTKNEFELLRQMRDKEISEIRNMLKDEFQQLRIETRNPQVYKK